MTFVLIEPDIGTEINAACPDPFTSVLSSSCASIAEDRWTAIFRIWFITLFYFYWDLQAIPVSVYQTESNTSPATLFIGGVMHGFVLGGTLDYAFTKMANESGRQLARTLDVLANCRYQIGQ
ncbi:hypothetical protein N7478_000849 [Penicillium angulare]|uniref:uncharacterized protein n=1 Tax=Penicillium angulare TaxID=116970 RepID=UPI00253FE7D4|nr:uncharacterized protein N7478_000849 [Penicillium angulare]KAJ5291598.1 hypothetical protein N7478_000849 [Penicillium angulare]